MRAAAFLTAQIFTAFLGSASILNSAAFAVSADNFRVNTTADLVTLCAADPSDANYIAAIHFCHGYASGAFQYYQALAAQSAEDRFVCLPAPPPTRSEAIIDFVGWAKSDPERLKESPIDAIFRYLGSKYPCSA